MAPEVNNIDLRLRQKIRIANTDATIQVVPDYRKSRLIPGKIHDHTPRSRLGTEFFIQTGIVDKSDPAEVLRSRRALSVLSVEFGQLNAEQRQEYRKFLGGAMLANVDQVTDVVLDHLGIISKDKMNEFETFMGFVAASVSLPDIALPEVV